MKKSRLPTWVRHWWFSLVLLAAYLAVFNAWFGRERPVVLAVGAAATALTAAMLGAAGWMRYFTTFWDVLAHAMVVLDIALEAILLPRHDDHGFYLCAAGFVVVVGGYRALKLHHRAVRRPDAAPKLGLA